MRAKEFIKNKQVDEALPFVAALAPALAKAATVGGTLAKTVGSSLVKGATTAVKGATNVAKDVVQGATTAAAQIGKQAIGTVGSSVGQAIGSTIASTTQQQKTPPPGPTTIPPGTKIEVVPSTKPNNIAIKIDGANVELDTTKPENKQLLQQLNQIKV